MMRLLAMAAAAAFLSLSAVPAAAQGTGGLGDGNPGGQQGCADPTFGGKYSEELRRLPIPTDLGKYGRCNDYGAWAGNSYAGYEDLPRGFWVYSYPNWIIFGRMGPPGVSPPAPGPGAGEPGAPGSK